MASKNSIAVLNIGAQRVGMALFKMIKGQLVLEDYKSTEILADPAAAASRNAQIKIAVSELSSLLNVQNRVCYAVSGQSVFTRFVRLPDLDGVDVDELVRAEAQQHVPFPLEEVKWDWAEITEVDGEKEVVIAAIKSRILNEVQDAVEGAGMHTTEVAPAQMSLYNAFRLNYPDVTEPCMLLDIGAKTSNVIYIDGKRVFNRSVAIGGATVTTAIAKEYDIPFLEAENMKKAKGLVALDTRHTSTLDDETGALATCIRSSLNRMPAEVARTTNYYRSQQGGSAPTRVFIAGGGSNLPKMAEFLQEKLRLPVEYFNPLRAVSAAKGMDVNKLATEAHLLGELVGLASRQTGKTFLQLDLVPDSVAKEKDLDKRKSKLILSGIALIVGMLVFWFITLSNVGSLNTHKKELQAEYDEIKPIADDMDALLVDDSKNKPIYEQALKSEQERVYWTGALHELKQTFAGKKYWFTEIKPIVNHQPDSGPGKTLSSVGDFGKGGSSTSMVPNLKSESLMINAIEISGVWLEEGQEIAIITKNWLAMTEDGDPAAAKKAAKDGVDDGNSQYFSKMLTYTDAKSKGGKSKSATPTTTEFEAKNMFRVKQEWDVNKIGSEFHIVLPLKNPIPVK